MTTARFSTARAGTLLGARIRGRLRRPGRRLLAGVAVLLVAGGVVVAVTDPFSGGASLGGGVADNGTATALATVARRSLSSQTQVNGTLGYAGSASVDLPAGTAPSSLRQAQQTFASTQAALRAAQAALAADGQTLAQAQATLTADQLKEASDCAGDNAAGGGSGNGSSGSGSSGSTPCAAAFQAVVSDEQTVASAKQRVAADQGQVAGDRVTLTGAQQSLAAAESSATVYDPGATYTMLPAAGRVIGRGQALYAIGGQPTLLLYGPVTAWRTFRSGTSPGRDVAELNANLDVLGYGHGLNGDSFTAATEQAITALQAARGLERTGALALGSVAFMPGPVRVTSVTPTVGQAVQAGAVLAVTSTRHQVAIELDAAQQSQVKVGDKVTVTLPDNSTTPGVVSKVGKVASTPSNSSGSSSTPTIEVDVRLLHEAAAGILDQAPVQVAITTASVNSALVVPVNALLALASGGYAVETVDAAGVHQLVAVTLGLFDDAEGLVQVHSAQLHAGERVVVPSS